MAAALRRVSGSAGFSRESEQLCLKTLEDTEAFLEPTAQERLQVSGWGGCCSLASSRRQYKVPLCVQVVKELLRLYSAGCKYEQAYAAADKMRVKLELSFSIDASQKLEELQKTVRQ